MTSIAILVLRTTKIVALYGLVDGRWFTGQVRTMRYDELARRVLAIPRTTRLVAVDGCGGAGKSTFAARFATVAGACRIVPTDDFASWENPLDWWPRMLSEVIEPLTAGEPASYRRYDWRARSLAEEVDVSPAPIVVLEGVSSSRSEWRDHLAFAIWVETPRDRRLRRGLARDGAEAAADWERWMAAEDAYLRRDRPMEYADLVVDGAPRRTHDEDAEFVLAMTGP